MTTKRQRSNMRKFKANKRRGAFKKRHSKKDDPKKYVRRVAKVPVFLGTSIGVLGGVPRVTVA